MTIRIHTMANGLRIVTEEMAGLKSASIGLWVGAGARNERADQNGIAHFLEHMAFKGTNKRNALQIAEAIEDVGGYLNAYTSRETTAYYARVLDQDVSLALDVIADIVTDPVFDPQEIETERGVILQEIGQAFDTPDDIIFDWLQEAAYPDQPIGRPILGPAERVAAFSRTDFRAFVDENYGPGQMVLAAAGAVDHDAIVKQAEEALSHLPAVETPQVLQGLFKGGERRVSKDLEQAHFALALESPDYKDPDIYTAQIFSSVFGGGMSSRLFQEAREKRGLCYTIFCSAGAFSDTGAMTIYAGTSKDQVTGLGELVIDELKRAATDIGETEVERARTQMKAGMLMGLESPSSRAERLARMVSIWGRVPDLEEVVERINGVSNTDVRDFAGQLASQANMALALYGPIEGAVTLDQLRARSVA